MPEELREWAQDTLTAMMAGLLFGGGKRWLEEQQAGAAWWGGDRGEGGQGLAAAARLEEIKQQHQLAVVPSSCRISPPTPTPCRSHRRAPSAA